MHWKDFINRLVLRQLSLTLGQAAQPVEAADDDEAAGKAMAEEAGASQEAAEPVCNSDSGEQAFSTGCGP